MKKIEINFSGVLIYKTEKAMDDKTLKDRALLELVRAEVEANSKINARIYFKNVEDCSGCDFEGVFGKECGNCTRRTFDKEDLFQQQEDA